MSQLVPYTVIVIKPLSIGRGDGPHILEDLLTQLPLSLRKFRTWNMCSTTWNVLKDISMGTPAEFSWSQTVSGGFYSNEVWVGLFTHKDRSTDPTELLRDIWGPEEMRLWKTSDLRYKYSAFKTQGLTTHPADTVVYISPAEKSNLIANLLFNKFDEEDL